MSGPFDPQRRERVRRITTAVDPKEGEAVAVVVMTSDGCFTAGGYPHSGEALAHLLEVGAKHIRQQLAKGLDGHEHDSEEDDGS